jgi:HEAT repeat protein
MKVRFLAMLLLLLTPLAGRGANGEEPVDRWRDVLLYGIDSEIIATVGALREAGERSLDGELLQVLRESVNTDVRLAVLQYYREIGFREAAGPVLALLSAGDLEDGELLIGLVRYFIDVPHEDSVPVLIGLLDHTDQGVALAAITALGKSGSEQAGATMAERLADPEYPTDLKPDLILALGSLEYAPAYDQLVAIIRDRGRERVERLYASDALGKIGDRRAIDELKKLFSEQDSLVKMYAASALANFGMEEVQDLLIQGLRDSNPRVRVTSARALADPGAKRAVNILIYKADNDPEKSVRTQALHSLGVIGGSQALDYLKELYLSENESLSERELALTALTDNHLSVALKIAAELISRDSGAKNQAALEFTAKKLAQLESPELKSLYEKFLNSVNPALRIYALRGIGKNRFREFRADVEELSENDPHPAVRQIAATVLAAL